MLGRHFTQQYYKRQDPSIATMNWATLGEIRVQKERSDRVILFVKCCVCVHRPRNNIIFIYCSYFAIYFIGRIIAIHIFIAKPLLQ